MDYRNRRAAVELAWSSRTYDLREPFQLGWDGHQYLVLYHSLRPLQHQLHARAHGQPGQMFSRRIAYLILHKCEWHLITIAANFGMTGAELIKHLLDQILQLFVRLLV